MDIAEKVLRQKKDFDDVYEAGRKAEYDAFWDVYQNNGSAKGYSYAFAGQAWKDAVYNPKYDIVINYTAAYMYYDTRITDTKIVIDLANGSGSRTTSYMFGSATSLVTILKLIVSSTTPFSNTFHNCPELVNLIIVGTIGQNGFDVHWSTKLSADSLKSIIDALSTTTTGLTITLPTTAQSNYEAVYGSGSWSTLTATKSNWTIAYA